MEHLLQYINGLPPSERESFAARCGTSIGYLRKAISAKKPLGESLCINIDRESGGMVRCEDLRPEVDWAYLRNTPETGDTTEMAGVAGDERTAQFAHPSHWRSTECRG